MQDDDGITSFTYDADGNLVQVETPDDKILTYTYDAMGRRLSMVDHESRTSAYTYDDAGRLIGLVNGKGESTTFTYNNNDRLVRKELHNGNITSQTYDGDGRLETVENSRSDATLISRFSYTYDCVGNRLASSHDDGNTTVNTTWGYDRTYQLTSEIRDGANGFHITYTYDDAGNRLTQNDSGNITTYTYDASNALTLEQSSSGTTTYTHDDRGNRQWKETPSTLTEYEWDAEDRLLVSEPITGPHTFTYDPDGRRTSKTTPTDEKHFLYDFNNLLAELDDTGASSLLYTTTNDEFGDLISQYDETSAASGYLHYDALGTTDSYLDDTEIVTDRLTHRAFGLPESHSPQSTPTLHTHNARSGYYRDTELDLYYVRARYYDPATGQWISKDPIGLAAGDPNLYRYVGNNPVNENDPEGLGDVSIESMIKAAELNEVFEEQHGAGMGQKSLTDFAWGMGEGLKEGVMQYVEMAKSAWNRSKQAVGVAQRVIDDPRKACVDAYLWFLGKAIRVRRAAEKAAQWARDNANLKALKKAYHDARTSAGKMVYSTKQLIDNSPSVPHSVKWVINTTVTRCASMMIRPTRDTINRQLVKLQQNIPPMIKSIATKLYDTSAKLIGTIAGMFTYEYLEGLIIGVATAGAASPYTAGKLPLFLNRIIAKVKEAGKAASNLLDALKKLLRRLTKGPDRPKPKPSRPKPGDLQGPDGKRITPDQSKAQKELDHDRIANKAQQEQLRERSRQSNDGPEVGGQGRQAEVESSNRDIDAPNRGTISVPQKVYTSTDVTANVGRSKGTFVTEIDITQPRNLVPHVQRNVPASPARPPGNLPRYVTEIEIPQGRVLPDPTVPFKPNDPTGWIPANTPGARVNQVFGVIEDAAGNVTIRPVTGG